MLKLRVTMDLPSGYTIPMVQELIKNGIYHQLRAGENGSDISAAAGIRDGIRVALMEATTIYSIGEPNE